MKNNRNRLRAAALAVLAGITLGSCVKDKLYNTPHPDKGAVRVTTDWSELSEDAVQPASYLLRIGELTHEVSGTDNTFKYLLDEGSHTLLVHNTPQGITVGSTTATVETLPDGTLTPMPDYLFSAAQALRTEKDDTLRVNVKMAQGIRSLRLVLRLKPGDEAHVTSTSATLTGIAHSIDLATGQADGAGAGKTVIPSFEPGSVNPTRAGGQPALIATLHLAGVASGGKQTLTLSVTLTGGTVQTITTDLSAALKDFGRGREPLMLDATLELPAEGSFGGTITDWIPVDNGDITIY